MASKFYTILTDIGAKKIANATISENKLIINSFAVGDGNGGYYQPQPTQTKLRHETYRGTIEYCHASGNTIKINAIIPANVGGFTIREAGVFDIDGNLIAITNLAETEKPLPLDGITYQLQVNITIKINGSVDCVEIVVDNINYTRMQEMIETAKEEIYKKTLYPGKIEFFAGDGALPPRALLCDGAEVSRVYYAGLFAAIGAKFGNGDGVNTFNLPDYTAVQPPIPNARCIIRY